ncbi:YobA family protein [Sporosarcina sp. ACRSL]|uniref:DUF3221 domain-containing protein n=1 Tax=Sporosarcina sp. ACRSL TaxID=2918215 RepID=UPI001EF3F11A|nr:DUF3221 domain-containing protein [Sporosarcina sp. ACRSL]MCG7343963.1 YobA family protein [Sporosarcina sp. ACRSL]
MRRILSLLIVLIVMAGCSYGIKIETFDGGSEEDPKTSIVDGISDSKILSGEVIKKRRKEITLELSESSSIGKGEIWIKVDDESTLDNIKKGQQVSVWYDYIRESNPPKTKGLKIEVDSKYARTGKGDRQ